MKRYILTKLCVGLVAAGCLSASPAEASPILWTIGGVTFTDPVGVGGTVSGSFVYDADLNVYSAINLVTTPASGFPGQTYTIDNDAFGFTSTASFMLALTAVPVTLNAPVLWMGYSAPLTNAGGTLSFNFIQETGCSIVNGGLCQGIGGGNPYRQILNGGQLVGTVPDTPVPEPTTLLLLGTGLAIAAARRRPAKHN